MSILDDINAETALARALHGQSFELASDDVKLRILVEEVGEVARALQDIENAEARCVAGSKIERTAWLEGARESVVDARAELRAELVQVASLAMRWIEKMDGAA